MPSSLRTPRTLSNWFELDYFRRRRLFRDWWRDSLTLAGILALACLGGLLYTSGQRSFQAGPLTASHAMFADRCEVCHQVHGATLKRLWSGDKVASVPDHACLDCHAGAHHNHQQNPGTCVSCHREHRGHHALVRISDNRCVDCHQDLHRQDGKDMTFARTVTAFDSRGGHPNFRWRAPAQDDPTGTILEKDPGTIHFNHHYHLVEFASFQQSLLARKDDPGAQARLATLGDRPLACASCHQADADGRTMKPISYHQHCQRCHGLQPLVPGGPQAVTTPLRHPRKGENASVVRADLRDRLTQFITGPLGRGLLEPQTQSEPRMPAPPRGATEEERAFAWVERHMGLTANALFDSTNTGCRKCHVVEGKSPDGLPKVAKPDIKDRWWQHANFRHDTHRMMTCTECHDVKSSKGTCDVLLPGITVCLQCHDASHSTGMARSDCVECHTYHDPKEQRAVRERSIKAIKGR